jgi:proteasome assembly chaperone (PAC2) family protein
MDENSTLRFEERPKLRSPYLICGFEGSLNGGDVSAAGVRYLLNHFKATKFAEIASSHFHVYQIPGADGLRPVFKMDQGLIVDAEFPGDEFYYARNPGSEHDLVLLLGNEPNLNWEEYADNVITLAAELNVSRLYAFGAILDRTPYFREPGITCTCTSAELKREIAKYRVRFSNRYGGATFNQLLVYYCQKKGLEGVNFTARAPYYPEFNLAIEYSPKSIKAVLARLSDLMRLELSFEELDASIREVQDKLDSIRKHNPQFNTYIEEIDKNYEEMPYRENTLNISANDAVRLAEEFLSRKKDEPEEK